MEYLHSLRTTDVSCIFSRLLLVPNTNGLTVDQYHKVGTIELVS